MGFKQILVTVDDLELGQVAVDYAEKIAEPGARIHLLNVAARVTAQVLQAPFEVQSNAFSEYATNRPSWVENDTQTLVRTEDYIKNLRGKLADKGCTVTTEVEFGAVVDTIVEIASMGFEVIVMTTHGRAGLARLVLGSVAEGVLRKAPCPVLLIPVGAIKNNHND
ncbi:MAG: universal stress protein [Aggregatilineales bacterium]